MVGEVTEYIMASEISNDVMVCKVTLLKTKNFYIRLF